ncbi:Sedlin, N-terminal conserved region [Rhizoctonia solani]|uniref:Sedlin, N-terminal conserved region n=1 Tax=Rhizoctonia solani TaxID=456999 RepID=A0A8H7IJC0_9AGAM|nr:Sedlin, N-terminal conserved region [Rhizoctonia solani]KAF8760904.1 Sedlin, N-terminal conserved region [Rhizoctonia solani]
MSRMRVNAVAFVYNQAPVLVRTYTASKDAELKYHYVAHTSLDVIDERVAAIKGGDCYLGLLHTMEDLAVYGEFCAIAADYVVRDADVVNIFRTLHTAYAAALSNPFYRLSAQSDLKAPTIENQAGKNNLGKRVDEIVRVIGTIPVAADEQV